MSSLFCYIFFEPLDCERLGKGRHWIPLAGFVHYQYNVVQYNKVYRTYPYMNDKAKECAGHSIL